MGLINKLFKGDRTIWIIFMIMCFVSLVEVYSATSTLAYRNTYYWTPIVRHGSFLLMGFAAVLLIHHIPSRFFAFAIILLPVSIVLLAITPFIGVNINEAYRFMSFMGVQFQPSEFGKLACIVFVAFMLSKQDRISPDKLFRTIIICVGITCAFILPENFSTAFLLFAVCFLMMFIGQVSLKKLGLILVFFALVGGIMFSILRYAPEDFVKKNLPSRFETWQARLDDFFDKEQTENKYTINDDNRQVNHAKIAIARGGIFGKMPGRSVQRDFLPQAYSDFIYAIIIEEMGLIGGIGVLMLYIILMFRVAIIARRCNKLFPKYLALGCGLLIVIQALIHMAVAVNLIPVTGQPLPLISRGGTSTMLTCFYFGIILSVSRFGAGMGENEEHGEDEENEETVADWVGVEVDDEAEVEVEEETEEEIT